MIWNKPVYEEFVRLAMLNETEQKVLETRIKEWTITKQCMELNLTRSTVNKIIKNLKRKYDEVQPMSEILKPRVSSAKELYMDTH